MGNTSTQGKWILETQSTREADALRTLGAIGYRRKGGDGVSVILPIGNKTSHELEFMKEQGFEGRYEWDPPVVIPPETAAVMVHRKRDGAAAGSSGYVEYAVRNTNDIVCFVYFGWYAPLSGATMVGCGWLDSSKMLTYDDQDKVRYQQYNNQRVYSQQHGLVVSIAVMNSRSSPEIQVVIEDVSNRLLETTRSSSPSAQRTVITPLRQEAPDSDSLWFISHDKITKIGAIGSGGFGLVHLASWADTKVVVKEISFVEMRRFLGEVDIWRRLTHPNVVPFYGANHLTEPYFIVSKYASNGELVPYLKREAEYGRFVTWRKLLEVAAGLRYLHDRGIVHGDLKGNNIVIGDDGSAMVMDFGLSFVEDGAASVVTEKKGTLGAMAWRAPEFVMMTTKPTSKSDVYSLGMCIIEAVTRKNPWHGYSNDQICDYLLKGVIKVDRPEGMLDAQWDLVKRMIALSPIDRPDLGRVITKLTAFASQEVDSECPYP